MVQGRKVLAADLRQIKESAASELASSPDLLELRLLLVKVRGLPPWGALGLLRGDPPGSRAGGSCPLARWCWGWWHLGRVVTCVLCRVLQGGCWLPLKLCTGLPTSTRSGVAGSTHGSHQPPPHAWRHPLLGLGSVATLPALRMTGGCANAFG
jgi:hypothetical protein